MGDGATWISTGDDTASQMARALVFVMAMALSGLAALGFWNWIRGGGVGRLTRRALGRPLRPTWDSGEWACGACHTVNRASNIVCEPCRGPRGATQMSFAGIPTEPDIIPATVPAGVGASVTLEHNPAAHADGLNGHWRLRVNSVVVGSAARRDGALALLRAVEGAESVLFDPNGAGYSRYALPALIAAFEGPRLPLAAPCPERGR
jgi:hypothetical protein